MGRAQEYITEKIRYFVIFQHPQLPGGLRSAARVAHKRGPRYACLLACLLVACLLATRLFSQIEKSPQAGTQKGPGDIRRSGTHAINASALERSPISTGGVFLGGRYSKFGGVGSRKSHPKTLIFPSGVRAVGAGTDFQESPGWSAELVPYI